jgi:hypothetical protein
MNKSVMVLLLGWLFSLSVWAGQSPQGNDSAYRLAPGDEVEIRGVWRAGSVDEVQGSIPVATSITPIWVRCC